ncbi:hypothetical protein H671_21284 [Cricetulus griseus]|uniref:Uncharacterized protein n=1 Tax=Cricetulus griseus TaxID=10029 RepID=A0A061HU05_CRIGR|nr:hypothetical protein H671_21284 [Cricetulus griseus]
MRDEDACEDAGCMLGFVSLHSSCSWLFPFPKDEPRQRDSSLTNLKGMSKLGPGSPGKVLIGDTSDTGL